jgi:hypothetical protein
VDNYVTDSMVLDGGLDLVAAKLAIKAGSLSDCLNYEIVDRSGYKRIDGFEPFDGDDDLYETPVVAGDNAQELSQAINTALATIRSGVTAMINQPIGLHWFRDRLYAVAEEKTLYFVSGGTTELLLYDYVEVVTMAGNARGRVVNIWTDPAFSNWAAGTAEGFFQIEDLSGAGITWPEDGATLRVYTDSTYTTLQTANIATVDTRLALTNPALALAASKNATLWQAKSTEQAADEGGTQGWNRIDTGVLVEFEDGYIIDGAYPHIDRRTQEVNVEYGQDSTTVDTLDQGLTNVYIAGDTTRQVEDGIHSFSMLASFPPTIVNSEAGEDYVEVLSAAEGYGGTPSVLRLAAVSPNYETSSMYSNRVTMYDSSSVFTIPGYAVIEGIEVYLDGVNPPTAAVSATSKYHTFNIAATLVKYDGGVITPLGTSKTLTVTNQFGSAYVLADEVLGSATDLWGASSLSTDDIINTKFGVSLQALVDVVPSSPTGVGTSAEEMTIDRVRIKVYYRKQFTRYYFWNGSNDVSADMIDYKLWEGDLLAGNGRGVMQLTNIQAVTPSTRNRIQAGNTIHVQPGGGAGSLVGEVSAGGVSQNALPGLNDLQTHNSRYQFITANFYGNDEWDAFFGVSGAGRAFSYDDTYFVTIFTQEDLEKDMPRHVAYHHFHLALGFTSGSVQFSVAGEPENFSGVDGATEQAVGDRITGLQAMRGTTLGVFCENSIWGISGTTRDNFATSVLAPTTGAIEYTVVDMGVPIYCDARGISTLSQSEKYGDFQGTRLSSTITPWVLPRLRRSNPNIIGVRCAIPIRAKNQYRVFFEDGNILTMTLVGGEMQPQFSFQKYFIGQTSFGTTTQYMVPICWSAQMDVNGIDRVHVGHYSTESQVSNAASKFVYELDRGWGFGGNAISANFTTNWNYASNPMSYKTLRKIVLEGVSKGYSNIIVQTSENFDRRDVTTAETTISLPRNPDEVLTDDFYPYYNINSLASRGRNISLKVTNKPVSITDPEPSHICQVMLLDFTSQGALAR